ncbi:MdtA/MuxA family multidrug efflux RND transporter periplasmic adaptor subunit [Xylophilus rhododendri]|uniref:MdtA/MuxA family multidrug efflux RND transporter periplasmic adaptor subunit n=1 Tax=Xylophilus rhododendri TaxID=2697032 RepID=A0A857J6B8_9BURK|nr:MdtA/MuxA family multidrug efflux RND transporter periplasmic adaptor subunit [Xylophilus rhododendri]QHI99544.1 MdtA/MuxA family multidrug efflux RND transporter periplasmic adaptor subunit [Xylophilus rhododendri]
MPQPLPPETAPARPVRPRRAGRTIAVLTVLVLLAAGGGWWWKRHHDAQAAASAVPGAVPGPGMSQGPGGIGGPGARRFVGNQAQPVSVARVQRRDVKVLLQAIGTVTAQNTAVVRTKVDGELQAIRFREGDLVKAGALLAQIDPRSYQSALDQAAGGLARDQAQLKNAQIDLQRYQDLQAQDSIAKQQVDTQAALVRQLQGTVQVDQALVDAARLNLSYTKVTAPISGRLGLRQADLGNVVHAADTNGIVTITQTQPINVLFSIPEASLSQIAAKLRAGQTLPVEAWDRDRRNKLATGQVNFIDNAIDTTTGTIKLKAVFANADGALFPNQFTNVVLQTDTLHGTLAVPGAAVQRGTQGTYVYAVGEDGKVAVRKITLGPVENDWTSVQGELHAGEQVVTDGADRLRDGAQVQVIAANAAAAADAMPANNRGRGGMAQLPPEVREKLRTMSPEDRRAYIQKLREQQGGAAGAAGATPGAAPAAPAAPAAGAATPAPAPAAPAAR